MTSDRWTRLKALFAQAVDLEPGAREVFLDQACQTDGSPDLGLRADLMAMLNEDAEAGLGSFGDTARPAPTAGPWRLMERIGEGGMGEVWRAERADGAYDQTAAVKLVRPGLAPDLLARFRAERQILAGLDHPAIARLIDGGTASDGRPYLALEYVDGVPITVYCDRHRLDVDARLALFSQVCDAVGAAHRQLVVHRDLKPSNVLVTEAGQVKLLDFGIAKLLDGVPDAALTADNRQVMTPEYAAPEQVRGEAVTTATDVYGLGVLLYELLTGTRPYSLESRVRRVVEQAILEAAPTDPSTAVTGADAAARARSTEPVRLRRRLRGDLDQIVLRALRKEPTRRYDSAAALAADLGRHQSGRPVEARPESARYRVGRFVRRNRVAVAAGVAVLLAVTAGAGTALHQAAEADRQRAEAQREAATATQVTTFMTDLFEASNSAEVAGDTVSARELLDQTLARVDSLSDAPDVQAQLLQTLGEIYQRLGRFDEAQAAYTRVVEIRRAAGDSLSVARGLASLGFARSDERAFPEAIALFRAALDRAGQLPDTLAVRIHLGLGSALIQNGQVDAARQSLAQAARFVAQTQGDDSDWARGVRTLRAQVLVRQQDYAGAQRLYRRNIRQLQSEGETSRLAGELNGLGYALVQAGAFADAAQVYGQSADIWRRTAREGHRNLAVVLSNQASAAYQAGDPDTAERLLREKVEVETTYQEPGHWRIGSAHAGLAAFFLESGQPAQAIDAHRQALAIYDQALGPGHPWTTLERAEMGLALSDTGEANAAARELDAAAIAFRRWIDNGDSFSYQTGLLLERLADGLDERGLARRAATVRLLITDGR